MSGLGTVAVLYARPNSIYKRLDGADVWDMERDARRWPGGAPVVAHPPCRAWGRLRHLAKPRPDEKELALHAVAAVREHGGVLEHPAGSTLWAAAGLPRPGGGCDGWGGWTLAAPQVWWGHRAEKRTWFYVVGAQLHQLPQIPFSMAAPTHCVELMGAAEREATPPALAAWLLEVARACKRGASSGW